MKNSDMWVAIDNSDREFPRIYGPFKSDRDALKYCQREEFDDYGAMLVFAPE